MTMGTLGKGLIAVWMTAGLCYVFLKLPAAVGFADPELARMITLHLPCAYVAVILAFVSGWHAIQFLRTPLTSVGRQGPGRGEPRSAVLPAHDRHGFVLREGAMG